MSLSDSLDYLAGVTDQKMVIFTVRPNSMTDEQTDIALGVDGFIIGITPYHANLLSQIPEDLTEQEAFFLEAIDIDWGKIPGLRFCAVNLDAGDKIYETGNSLVSVAQLGTIADYKKITDECAVYGFVYYKFIISMQMRRVYFTVVGSEDPIEMSFAIDLQDLKKQITKAYEKLSKGGE